MIKLCFLFKIYNYIICLLVKILKKKKFILKEEIVIISIHFVFQINIRNKK